MAVKRWADSFFAYDTAVSLCLLVCVICRVWGVLDLELGAHLDFEVLTFAGWI